MKYAILRLRAWSLSIGMGLLPLFGFVQPYFPTTYMAGIHFMALRRLQVHTHLSVKAGRRTIETPVFRSPPQGKLQQAERIISLALAINGDDLCAQLRVGGEYILLRPQPLPAYRPLHYPPRSRPEWNRRFPEMSSGHSGRPGKYVVLAAAV